MGLLAYNIGISIENSEKLKKIMAKQQDFDVVLGRIDAATNGVAQEVRDLKTEIVGKGLGAEAEDALLSKLDAVASKLEGIGADPSNPAPATGDTTGSTTDATGTATTGTDTTATDTTGADATDAGTIAAGDGTTTGAVDATTTGDATTTAADPNIGNTTTV